MTLLEFLGDRASSFQVQIFGTDLNEKGIQKARAGIYRESIAEEISPERMARFFVKVEEGYRVNKAVRDMCVFARQNLATDPPFSQMNLVACRNLLIYIQPLLQKKIIPILHYALKPSGFLVLGSSESVSAFPDLFSMVDKKHKIYSKKLIASRLHYDFAQSHYQKRGLVRLPGNVLQSRLPDQDELDVQSEADRAVLREHSPVGVVINDSMEVVQFRGQTAPYLAPPPGRPSVNVLKLARNGLAIELRALITEATKNRGIARKNGIQLEGTRMLNLSVTPLGDKPSKGKGTRGRHFFLILFEDVTPLAVPAAEAARGNKSKSRNQSDQDARRLERELASAREALRSAIEAEDSFKEEFQSANEEILSANEELQSTNEELETSKEELQSANEELSTLNAELRDKNSELHDLSNDILNLLNSTRIPVVMLDRRLYIRRITPAATKLFKVVPADIGRPFADIKLNIEESDITSHDLELQITKVLDSLLPSEREVRDLEGCWHSLSILPYRTQENKIDGVVLALKDIHAVKSANELLMKSDQVLRASEERFRTLFNMGPVAVYYCDVNGSIQNYNQRAVELWGRAPDDGETDQQFRGIFKLFRPDGSILPLEQSPMAEVLSGKVQEVRDQEVIMERPDGSRIVVVVNILRLESSDGEITGAINCFYDISERKLTEAAMMKSEKLAAAGRLAATLAHEINNPLQAVANLVTIWAQTPGLDAQGRTYANMAESELRRVSHLTQQSLSFYRETSAPAPVNVEETIDTVLAIYEKRIEAKRIQVKKRYRSDGAMIRTFPGELRQVISTLLLNATEAIDENGTITVRVRNASHVQNPAIRGVRITFADSGVGISESNLPRIFEPFYTTKGEKGTGLGLWVASGIVDRSGGSIQTRSNACPDKHGTCFSIFLPAKP